MKKLFTPSSSSTNTNNAIVNDYQSHPISHNNNTNDNSHNKAKIKMLSIDNTNEAARCLEKHLHNNNDISPHSKTPPLQVEHDNANKMKYKTSVNSESKLKVPKKRAHSKAKMNCNLSSKLKSIKNPLEGVYVIENIYKRKTYKYKLKVFQKLKEIQLISQFKSKFRNYPSVQKAFSKNNIAKTTDNVLCKIKNSIQHGNLPGSETFKKRSLKQGMRKLKRNSDNDNHIHSNPLRKMYLALYWIKWLKRVHVLQKFEHDERNKHKVKRILLQQQVNPIRKYFIVKYLKKPFELIKAKAFKHKAQ